jgi:hypothetical protein
MIYEIAKWQIFTKFHKSGMKNHAKVKLPRFSPLSSRDKEKRFITFTPARQEAENFPRFRFRPKNIRAPGANVIKLFTPVSYDFS